MKKKILFVGNTAWSMFNFRRNLFKRLLDLEYDVWVVAPYDKGYFDQLENLGCVCSSINLSAKGTNPIKDFLLYRSLVKIIKNISPDFCVFYTIKPNIYGSLAATKLKIPCIPVTTGLGYTFLKDNLVSKIAKLLYRIAFKKVVQVWFLNNDDKQSFVDAQLIQDKKTLVLKGEGLDVENFELKPFPQNLSFLLMARMLKDKGVCEFVEAAKRLKGRYPFVSFNLLGFLGVDNPSAITSSQMREWCNTGVVSYLGSTSDVRPYIQDASCVVLPSYYREGIPFSLLEGAAMGRPLIATDVTGCKEVVDDGVNGFLCLPKNVDSLVSAMEKVIQMSPERRIEMGLAGRRKVEQEFNISFVVDEYINVLNKYLK